MNETLDSNDPVTPARGSRRRTVALGTAALAGGLALTGAGAMLLGPGNAVATSKPTASLFGAAPAAPASPEQERAAFFDAGYTYDDAVALAKTWNSGDAFTAKATAGQKLLDGETLPLAAGSSPQSSGEVAATKESAAVEKFFSAGYDYADAVKLAALWHTATPYEAKVEGGQKLLDGETLPVQP